MNCPRTISTIHISWLFGWFHSMFHINIHVGTDFNKRTKYLVIKPCMSNKRNSLNISDYFISRHFVWAIDKNCLVRLNWMYLQNCPSYTQTNITHIVAYQHIDDFFLLQMIHRLFNLYTSSINPRQSSKYIKKCQLLFLAIYQNLFSDIHCT